MYFVLQTPSLQHLAGVNIVAQLWAQRGIFTQTACLPVKDANKETIEEKVKSKVGALPLAERLKKQLLILIKPMRMEINKWYSYCEGKINYQFLDNLLPNQLCWTTHGTIDYKRTAELMVTDERMSLERRYEIACINCLEDQAWEMFERMGKERRREYVNRVKYSTLVDDHHLIVFFTCTLSGDVAHLRNYFHPMMLRSDSNSLNKCLFQATLRGGNRATFEYLFKKLSQREKKQVFEECRRIIFNHKYSFSTCSILYYLSLLNAEQQEDVFRNCMVDLLLCLLRWPLQSLFVEAAECVWQLMDNRARTDVLRAIISKISNGFADYDYAQLFWECWRLSSAEYKQIYFDDFGIVFSLFQTKEEEFIQLFLNEAPVHQILSLCNINGDIWQTLTDEKVISDAALMECKETAALNSFNEPEDEENRLRSKYLNRLVFMVMVERLKRRLVW